LNRQLKAASIEIGGLRELLTKAKDEKEQAKNEITKLRAQFALAEQSLKEILYGQHQTNNNQNPACESAQPAPNLIGEPAKKPELSDIEPVAKTTSRPSGGAPPQFAHERRRYNSSVSGIENFMRSPGLIK
jgi:chromosome segregation ATPase